MDVSLPGNSETESVSIAEPKCSNDCLPAGRAGCGTVKLAINLPVEGCKYRAIRWVAEYNIEQITRPLSLRALLKADLQIFQRRSGDFADKLEQRGCEVYVYGSMPTKLLRDAYVRPVSDLDMLLYPQHQNDVPEILQLIQQVQTQSSVHLDGR